MVFHRGIVIAMSLLLTAMFVAPLQAAEPNVPNWKKALPGTRGYLDDDGGGADTAIVCDTADRYRDWLNFSVVTSIPPGCQAFQHGLRVVIEAVVLDQARDTVASMWLPLVKIKIPSRNFRGYIQLFALHPEVPAGTVVHSTYTKLYKTADANDEGKVELENDVTATVLSYDPTDIDKLELYVSINDGSNKGRKGWMRSSFGKMEDGHMVDKFDQALIDLERK